MFIERASTASDLAVDDLGPMIDGKAHFEQEFSVCRKCVIFTFVVGCIRYIRYLVLLLELRSQESITIPSSNIPSINLWRGLSVPCSNFENT
jgi:hypothetical protein